MTKRADSAVSAGTRFSSSAPNRREAYTIIHIRLQKLAKNRPAAVFFAEKNFRLCWKNTFFLRIVKESLPHHGTVLSGFRQRTLRKAAKRRAFAEDFRLFRPLSHAVPGSQDERENPQILPPPFPSSGCPPRPVCSLSGESRSPASECQIPPPRESVVRLLQPPPRQIRDSHAPGLTF